MTRRIPTASHRRSADRAVSGGGGVDGVRVETSAVIKIGSYQWGRDPRRSSGGSWQIQRTAVAVSQDGAAEDGPTTSGHTERHTNGFGRGKTRHVKGQRVTRRS